MQQDLFDSGVPQATGPISPQKRTFFERFRISLRFDHALLVGIVFIILFVLFFSFGVESGKRFSTLDLYEEQQTQVTTIDSLRREIALLKRQLARGPGHQASVKISGVEIPEVKLTASAATESGAAVKKTPPIVADASEQKPQGKYTIQTVTYKTETDAQRQIDRYKKLGLSSFVIPSGSYIQVCVNAFESRTQATQKLRQMKTEGVIPSDAFVRGIPH